jgi:hypothetical protein
MGYDQNSKAYRLVNNETSKLMLNHNVVFNEEVCIASHEKTLFQKEPKGVKLEGMKQTIPLEEEEFDIDRNVIVDNITFLETFDVQVSSFLRIFVDLPIFAMTPRKVDTIPNWQQGNR